MSVIEELPASVAIMAIEQNFIAFTSSYVCVGHGQVHEEPELTWVSTGTPLSYFNGVLRTDLTTSDPDTSIEAVVNWFQARNQLMSWWVGPSTRPTDVVQRLEAHGLTYSFQDVGMAADLRYIDNRLPSLPGLVIERVKDEQTMHEWIQTFGLGFNVDETILGHYSKLVTSVPRDSHDVGPFYLARLNGVPVATSALCCAAGVAGIYEVSTIPSARDQGIGAAIAQAPMLDARAMGYHIAVLQASTRGEPVYRSLGFNSYCTLDAYCWRPLATN
jgi:hypothetical protein